MEIRTERLLLRHICEDDAQDIYEYAKNENVGPNAGWKPHADIDETREVMKAVFLNQEWVFAMVYDDKVIGTIGFLNDPKRENDRVLMLGYALGYDYWGRALTAEAGRVLLDAVFANTDIDAVTSCCYTYNDRSRRVIEKLGFEFEGVLHKAEKRFDGKVFDMRSYILTRENYLAKKI